MNVHAAWRLLDTTHADLCDAIERALLDRHGLPLVTFKALDALANDDGRLGMLALAHAVGVTRSGCTRLVDRAERDGLVARAPSPTDARHVLASLTDAGRAALDAARPTFAAALADRREQLAALGHQLADHAGVTRP